MRCRSVETVLLAIALGSFAMAQEVTTQPMATSAPSASTQPAQLDPTQPDPRLRPFLSSAGSSTRPSAEKSALPRITKRAFLQTDNHEPEALLDIEGSGMFSIQKGSTVTITTRQGASLTIRITKLSADEIEIETPATGQKVTLR